MRQGGRAKPKRIVDALSWAAANYRESDRGAAVSWKWSEINATVPDRVNIWLLSPVPRWIHNVAKLGLCLCVRRDAGKNLVQKLRHFVRVLKQVFPPHSAQRHLLIDGRVVVRPQRKKV